MCNTLREQDDKLRRHGSTDSHTKAVTLLGWFMALFVPWLPCWALSLAFQPAWAQNVVNPQWNILLISIDTLRADHLGAYGYHSVTPNLDRLAKEGVVFEQVFTSVPLTLPAHASLLTSTYPPVNGIRDNGETLPSSIPTVAEQMRAHGLQTAAFVSSFVLDRRFGLARGFDEYWGQFSLVSILRGRPWHDSNSR